MLIISKVYRSCLQNHTGAYASVVIEADLLEVGGGLGASRRANLGPTTEVLAYVAGLA